MLTTARLLSTDRHKVTHVKSIYLLNVVIKQESLIKSQKTGDVLSCYMQQSSIHYTLLYMYINSRMATH